MKQAIGSFVAIALLGLMFIFGGAVTLPEQNVILADGEYTDDNDNSHRELILMSDGEYTNNGDIKESTLV